MLPFHSPDPITIILALNWVALVASLTSIAISLKEIIKLLGRIAVSLETTTNPTPGANP